MSLHFYSNGNEFNRYFYRYFNSEKSIPITKQFANILENYIHDVFLCIHKSKISKLQ